MNNRNINQLISDYLWGTISEEDRLYLEQTIFEDNELKKKYEQLLDKTNLVERYRLYNRIEPYNISENDAQKDILKSEYAEEKEKKRPNRLGSFKHRAIPLLRYAAILICVVLFGILLFNDNTKPQPPQLSEEILATITQAEQSGKNQATLSVKGQTVAVSSTEEATATEVNNQSIKKSQERVLTTRHDSEFWLTLEDGTRVHLNYGTSFTYPLKFTGGVREVDLDGEAYFFVAKDAKHPYIINIPNGKIKVYGTEFNVNTNDDTGMTRIILINGSISVTPNNGKEIMMKPGEMAMLTNNGCYLSSVDITPYVSWNTGSFVFDDCPLEKLMKVLSLWYNKHVEFDREETRQIEFTGTINKYGDIEPALKAIHNVTGLRITINNNLITISQPQ